MLIPATVSEYVSENSYVVSPITQITSYSKDELHKIDNLLLEKIFLWLIKIFQWPLRWMQIDRTQVLNNLCLSTNMYGSDWSAVPLATLRNKALGEFPRHALMMRSVNEVQHPVLYRNLMTDGWSPVVNRQVYLYLDAAVWSARHNVKIDNKLLCQPGWIFVPLDPQDMKSMRRVSNFYDQLYLHKYSMHNVRFTEEYFRQAAEYGLLDFYGLFYHGEMLGVVGMCELDGTVTVPVVGYDTSKPQKLALYRRLMAFSIRYAFENNLSLNLSSGAPQFKRNRGGQPVIEVNFVYTEHLPFYRKFAWATLSVASRRLYKPLLEKYQL